MGDIFVPEPLHPPSLTGKSIFWVGIVLGVVIVVALLTKGFGLFGDGKPAPDEPQQIVKQGDKVQIPEGSALRQRIGVAAAPAEMVTPRLELPGIIEADPARTAAVLPALAGRLIELKVSLGERVAQGDILAVIRSPDLAQAYDDDDKAADALALTDKNLKRQEEQFKLGTASARDLDQARSDRTQAAAEYARTQTRLKVIGAPVEKGTRDLVVRAPISGSITTLSVAPGNMINDPTQPLMTIADLSVVWVTAQVPEKDVGAVAKDQAAEVRLAAYPDEMLRGKVLFVSDVLEPDTRRDKIRIAFQNPDYRLKPNMFATVTVQGAPQSRIVLPTAALLMNNDRTSVFVETAPWTFERRVVEPQLEEGQSVAIRSGLTGGEKVVVKGGILLND
jgi:cobalt-zinc-cadmium efflux system membrane fusion protein